MRYLWRTLFAVIGVVALVGLAVIDAEAQRAGRGGSIGSRGSKTYTPPPSTNTAPSTARPIERSTTAPSATQPRAATPAPAQQRPGLFNRPGFLGGLAAGLLGAGLIGLLMGNGLLGGLGGLASILGLLIQVALIGGVAYLLLRWWQRRSQPAPAYAGGPSPALAAEPAPAPEAPRPLLNTNSGSAYGAAAYGQQQQPGKPVDEIGIQPADYEAFERLLGEIQTAYSREDAATLRTKVTPEMMGYLQEEIADNVNRGVRAQLSGVKLLQGDLAEAWREDGVEYATVAMRYELIDTLVDRKSGRVVEGDPSNPVEAVEVWTFSRERGGPWMLSAIQQIEEEA